MAESDFVAAVLLCRVVKDSPSHPSAEAAGSAVGRRRRTVQTGAGRPLPCRGRPYVLPRPLWPGLRNRGNGIAALLSGNG